MKKVGKFLANILIVAYAVIAIVVTILLLSYNDYHDSVIGGYTFILLTDDELEEYGFEEGSLVLVKETKPKNIKEGDYIFVYRYITTSQFERKYAQVLAKDTSGGEYKTQYILDGNTIIDHEDVIGSTKDMKVIPHLGTILSILESRYGYLFLIVVVSFIAFLYEIYELIMEVKYGERENYYEDDKDDEEDDEYDDEDEYDEEDDEEYEEEEEVVVKPKKKAKTSTEKKAVAKKSTEPKVATKKATTSKTTTTKKTTATKTATTKTATTKKAAAPKATTTKKTTEPKVATAKKTTSSKGTTKKATTKTTTQKKQ